jgi:uncharacterized membrane protein
MSTALRTLTIAAALASGLMAGVFYAFSSFVMEGLRRLPAAQGIAAMQSINITAVRPAFMAGFGGTTVLCVAVAVAAFVRWNRPASFFLLAGSVLYLVGAFVLTAVYHQPHNLALGELDPHSATAAQQWSDYVSGWMLWNHLRAVASLAAAGLFTVALIVQP